MFKKRKIYEIEDVSSIKLSEREFAIEELERRRAEINSELESLMRPYSKLTKNKAIAKRKRRSENPPNEWRKKKLDK